MNIKKYDIIPLEKRINMKKTINQTLWISIISSVLFCLFGIILITNPEKSLTMIAYGISILLIANGIYQLIMGYHDISFTLLDGFSGGLLSIILGILILVKPNALTIMIPIAIGLWFIVSSAYKLRIAIALRSTNQPIWLTVFIMAVLMMICGVILLFNPMSGVVTITRVIGILAVIYACIDIIDAIIIKRNLNLLDELFH